MKAMESEKSADAMEKGRKKVWLGRDGWKKWISIQIATEPLLFPGFPCILIIDWQINSIIIEIKHQR